MADYPDPEATDRGREDQATLDQEIARKYDPAALSRLVMRDAGRGEPLDLHTRAQMERRLGSNFGGVRVFRGPLAEEITQRYRADAVTVGGTEMILVREGARSNFESSAGRSLLAHELTHVRQQQRGLHFAQQGGGGEDSEHEKEARQVEASVHAEEQGHQGRDKRGEEKRFWTAVRQEVLRLYDEHKETERTRGPG